MTTFTGGTRSGGGHWFHPEYSIPWFRFLDKGDNGRGQVLLPAQLTVDGEPSTVSAIWKGQDYDSALSSWHWPEAQGQTGKDMARTAGSASNSIGITSAGGLADRRVTGGVLEFTGASKTGLQIASGNDFVIFLLARATATGGTDYYADSYSGGDGLNLRKDNGLNSHNLQFGDAANNVDYVWRFGRREEYMLASIFCDRSHSSGLQGYHNRWGATAGNPSAITGAINGADPQFLSDIAGVNNLAGGVDCLAIYQAAAGWLDGSSKTPWLDLAKETMADLMGVRCSVYQGDQSYPIQTCSGSPTYNIDGTSYIVLQGMQPLESTGDGVVYARFTSTYLQYWNLPPESIPPGNFRITFTFRRNGTPASTVQLFSLSDASSAENAEVALNSSGYLVCKSDSAGGTNGSTTGTVNVCDNTWQTVVVTFSKTGITAIAGGETITDSSSTALPQSPTAMRMAANYDRSVKGSNLDFRAGPTFGLRIDV